MKKKIKFNHPRLLYPERKEMPILPEVGDEIFCNGVFYFNITALLDCLGHNPQPIVNMPIDMWLPLFRKKIAMWRQRI